jgi:hypothetical protein
MMMTANTPKCHGSLATSACIVGTLQDPCFAVGCVIVIRKLKSSSNANLSSSRMQEKHVRFVREPKVPTIRVFACIKAVDSK